MTIDATKEQFLPYAKQSIDEGDVAAVTDALRSAVITRGPQVEAFERAVAEYCGVAHAVAFSSGTAALHAAAYAAKASPYDRIVSTPNTFVATVSSGVRFGARPLFVDIDPSTGNVDIEEYAKVFDQPQQRGKTLATVVHFAGVPIDMHHFDATVKGLDTFVIEDAAHALGSRYPDGERVGCCRYSDVTVFSFHPAKTITSGEGGMAVTHDAAIADALRHFRNSALERRPEYLRGTATPWAYEVDAMTGNYHMSELHAALGLSQLRRLDTFIERRFALMQRYHSLLAGVDGVTLLGGEPKDGVAYHLCVVKIDFEKLGVTREAVMQRLQEGGIGTQVHYIPVYRHPYFTDLFGDQTERFPGAEAYYAQALSLPLYYEMEDRDVERVCSELRTVLAVGE